MLGSAIRHLRNHHTTVPTYLNPDIQRCSLTEYDHASKSFKAVGSGNITYEYVCACVRPVLLTTPTCVYVWLPEVYWREEMEGRQQLALSISQVNCECLLSLRHGSKQSTQNHGVFYQKVKGQKSAWGHSF